jgi:hypothetical protein
MLPPLLFSYFNPDKCSHALFVLLVDFEQLVVGPVGLKQ